MDGFLLENGIDRYLIEDGLGIYLLEQQGGATPSITSWRMMRGIGQACFLLFLTIVDRFLKDRV